MQLIASLWFDVVSALGKLLALRRISSNTRTLGSAIVLLSLAIGLNAYPQQIQDPVPAPQRELSQRGISTQASSATGDQKETAASPRPRAIAGERPSVAPSQDYRPDAQALKSGEKITATGITDQIKKGNMKEALKMISAKYDINKIGNRAVGRGMNFYSLDREIGLGKELSIEVELESRLLGDHIINEYVNRIGQHLVRNSDAQVPFTIKIVDNDEVNACALPGGFFYVNTGLIMAADNEAELASVMAHEIAHVAARHATKMATRSQIWNLMSIPLVFVGGPAGAALRQFASFAVPMTFLKFGRDAEREADLLGMQYEYAAGYDPAAFVGFFEKLDTKEKKHSMLAKTFSTHPMNEDRIHRAQSIAEVLPARDKYVVTTSEFDEIKARLANLMNRHRLGPSRDGGRPTLRRRTPN